MSGAISGSGVATGWGLASQLAANSAQVRTQMNTLIAQASSGLVGQTYSALGAGASTAISLQPQIAQMQTWQANIAAVSTTMQVSQGALQQISSLASSLRAQTSSLDGLSGTGIASVAAAAGQALTQVAQLLNTQSDGQYVFAGLDTANPPVPNANTIATSTFSTQIATAVAALGTNGASATMASIMATAGSNAAGTTPFSAGLAPPAAVSTVLVGPGQSVPTGVLANANANGASTGTNTSGSYMRDIMANLAALASLPASAANDPNLTDFASQVGQSLANAVSGLNTDAGVLGNQQAGLQTTSTNLGTTITTLQKQVSGVEDVDMASTLSQLTAVQTQLQASYQLISNLPAYSLVKFLPAAA